MWERILLLLLMLLQLLGGMEPAEIALQASVWMDEAPPEDGGCTLVLWDDQYQILQRAKNCGTEVAFEPVVYVKPGQYVCYVTQEAGDDLSVAYDTNSYRVQVNVMLIGGVLSAQVGSVARVSGDPLGQPTVLERFDSDEIPVFRNYTRNIELMPIP